MNSIAKNNTRVRNAGAIVLAALGSLFFSTNAMGDSGSLVVYSDLAGANELLAGNYDAAIKLMQESNEQGEAKISLLNNLCVAYTLSGEYEAAHITCDELVAEASQLKNYDDWSQRYNSARTMRRYSSKALANRAVLEDLSQSKTAAVQN